MALLLMVQVTGCGKGDEARAPSASPAVTRTAADGPVTVTLTVSPGELSFTERAEVLVEVTADKSATVEVPEYDRAAGHLEHQYEYRLSRRERQAAVPTADGKLEWTYRYEVQFFLPGEYEFPPATVSYTTPPTTSTPEGHTETPQAIEIKTESIKLAARDPSGKTLSAEELKQIAVPPPVELPGPWSRWCWAVAVIAAFIALGIWLLRRGRPAVRVEPPLPAHEWARRQIARLVSDDLIAKGMIQEFYYRISGIVRGYIERRFAVSAPEMTTEEFLAAAARDGRFPGEHTASLKDFLTACDLVKYARQIPGSDEAEQVLKTAGTFVERTREDETQKRRNTETQKENSRSTMAA